MQDKDLYTLALIRYQEEHPDIDYNDMFSVDWNLNKDYKLKTIIVAKAIKNHTLVEETELYQKHFTRIRR